jgi:alpha-L-glutamate ligase-like protein
MNLIARWRELRRLGVLGANGRNTRCILDHNPRDRFPLVDSKRAMHELCRSVGVPTPDLYASLLTHAALRHLPRLVARHDEFVIKPDRGAGGRGILVVTGRGNGDFVRQNGRRMRLEDLRRHTSEIISGLYSLGGREDEALLQERIRPDPSLERVSYRGTADIRIVLYRCEPVMAMLRLPTRQSGGRANLHRGAVGAGVELASGVTESAVLGNRAIEFHPDTGARILGHRVADWDAILTISRTVSRAVGLGYLGVDIVYDCRRGPLVLEANARPGLAIQIANRSGLLRRLEEVDRVLAVA